MIEPNIGRTERATVPDFTVFAEAELTMARDALRSAATVFNHVSCLSNHMRSFALEDMADDWEAALQGDLEAVEAEMQARGLPSQEVAHG